MKNDKGINSVSFGFIGTRGDCVLDLLYSKNLISVDSSKDMSGP